MDWKNYFFQWFVPKNELQPILYGRGVHALPNPDEHTLFEQSAQSFIKKNILEGYRYFLESITHRPFADTKHLEWILDENELRFILKQGSAIIHGTVTPDHFHASAKIAVAENLHVALKRRFLERNFQLTYCRYSEKKGIITLGISLDNITMTPQKIFFPLRELSLNADFEKEFIASEFDENILLEYDHLEPLDSEVLKRRYEMMKIWIKATKASLVGLLSNDNSGMASFSYLSLLLQIDYLLVPHKKMAKEINEKIGGYFLEDEKLTEDKNADLEIYLDELERMNFASFQTQFYNAPYTFSPYDQAMHDEIAAFIDESLTKVRWYKNNHATYVIGAIYHYIALYILYNYGLHPSLRALLHLHVEVYVAPFFEIEEGNSLYDAVTGTFRKDLIEEKIELAILPYQERFKGLKNFSDQLNYSNLHHFSHSFYIQLKNLDYQES